MPAELDIEVPRNGDYFAGWHLEDDQGNPIDTTDWGLILQVRAVAGRHGAPIASAFITARDDAAGAFNIRLRGADFDSVEGTRETVTLAYDFLATDAGGIKVIETRGHIYLKPGVTLI